MGRAREAILVLGVIPPGAEESIELRLARVTAYAAAGDSVKAMAECEAALKKEPKNLRVRMKLAELQREREARR